MKKKGFTLIELLAVIVVLAIIAVIATPMVLGVIDDAKKGAAIADAYVYAEEVERYMVLAQLDQTKLRLQPGVSYQLSSKKYEIASLADPNEVFINDLVKIKGDKPTSGYVILSANGKIEKMEMVMASYPIECKDDACKIKGESVKDEVKEEVKEDETVILIGDSVFDKVKSLVYDDTGVCKTDGSTYNYMGGCYIKGVSTNNYLWYNGFMWRIMGINRDNTVRLITDENVTALAYGTSDSGLTYATNEGYIHDWLNEYFYDKLNDTKTIIQEGAYFCSQNYGNANAPRRTTCASGSEVTAKVGLVAADELALTNISSSYLHLKQTIGSMTPSSAKYAWFYQYGNVASMTYTHVTNMLGIRPVINVSPDAVVTSGSGSAAEFYILGEDKSTNRSGLLGSKVTSGEYVKLEGKTYRVVSKDNKGVKLVLDGFYEETAGKIYTMSYGSDNTFSLDTGIGKKLNGDVLTWLGLSSSDDRLVKTIYYQGDGIAVGSSYIDTLKQSNGVESLVGLIQVGDILSNSSSTMLTKNYTTEIAHNNMPNYWTMNKGTSASNAAYVSNYGVVSTTGSVGSAYALRPVIVVKNNLNITGGNGTWNNPYQI